MKVLQATDVYDTVKELCGHCYDRNIHKLGLMAIEAQFRDGTLSKPATTYGVVELLVLEFQEAARTAKKMKQELIYIAQNN